MDLVSSIEFSKVDTFPSISQRINLCAISRKNLIAFTAPRCYKLKRGGDVKQQSFTKIYDCDFGDFGGVADTIFVCPLASPWNAHVVVPLESEIKQIVWDPSGTKLLTADASGQIFLWQMQESIINKWIYTNFTRSMYGDDVIALKWANSTHLFTVAKDVRDHTAYEKRFPLACANVALGSFGGRSIDVWVAVTSSGVVGIGIVQPKVEMVVTRVTLESFEGRRLKCADIVVEANGSIQILSTTGRTKDPIRLHKLTTEITSNGYFIQSNSCLVTSDCFSCFFVDKCTENDSISCVQYVQPLSGHIVLVGIDKTHGTEIQQWTKCEETLGLHTAFHANTIIPEKDFHWIRQTSAQLNSYVSAYATSPLISDNTSLFSLGSAFACDDQILRIASRLSLSEIHSCPTQLSHSDERIISLTISPNGCVCVAMTTKFRMLVFGANTLSVEHFTTLLEYDMVTGLTWEDVLICIRSDGGIVDKVSAALETSLAKQSAGTQAQCRTKLDIIKIALSMSSESNFIVCADRLAAQLLHHIKNSFMAAYSTSDYDECEKNAEEKFRDLLQVSANSTELDIDKLVALLEPSSDFLPEDSEVSGFQPLVQWVCDLAVTLLSSLPGYTFPNSSGSWLAKDLKSLNSLRDLLLLIRLWCNTNAVPKLRPILQCGMGFDLLAKLFRLLTTLTTALRDGTSLPDTLIEECSLLPNQIMIPPFEKSICWSQLPISLGLDFSSKHFFGEGAGTKCCLRIPFGQYSSNGRKDVYSQIAVNNVEEYKQCIRCHALTSLTRQSTDQQKTRNLNSHYCVCGGLWYIST